jgi:mannose/cellobiose epimerase-like protein (N-acyl-D-glucosamine 2-epimerase family)
VSNPPTDQWLAAETGRLLTGALASVPAEGGGFGWLDDRGVPDHGRARPLWIAARMTHLFSLGTLLGRAQDVAAADHGVASLSGAYRDAEHGGWFPTLDPHGRPSLTPPDTVKAAYEHAFVLLAAASASVAGRPGARALLESVIGVVLERFWDDGAGALRESFQRDWSGVEDYRGANANMHGVEAFLAAADATGDDAWLGRALRIAERLVNVNARAHEWRIPEHFDAGWTPLPEYNRDQPDHPFRPYGATPGHGLEWSRLLLHLDAALRLANLEPPGWLVPAAAELFGRAVTDGWDGERGGFVYTVGWDGIPIVRRRFHWVVCEAIGAAAALAEAGPEDGRNRYRAAYAEYWDFARTALIEPAAGVGWLHELDEWNHPAAITWAGRPDWYHAVQATLIPRLPLAPGLAVALRRPRPSAPITP